MKTHHALERLKDKVRFFTRSNQPGAMLVHGSWGVGKTYGVLEALKATTEAEQIPFSYISLYGIASLDDIYIRLVMGWMNKISSKMPPWVKEILESSKRRDVMRMLMNLTSTFCGKERVGAITATASSAIGLLVNKAVVVIDDLERKDPALNIQAILGVVSFLVESRECRVIFITNDGEVKETEKLVFDAHKEKVFDFEVSYSPTVEENATIFATNYQDLLLQPLLALGISNLRVIRRTVRVLESLDLKIPKDCNLSRISVLTSAAKICCLYFGFREKVKLDRIKDISSIRVNLYFDEDMNLTEGDELFLKADFSNGPCDDFLIEVIRTGETDWSEFAGKVRGMQNHHEELQANSIFEQKLRMLTQNYSNNDPNIAQYIKNECEDKLLFLRPEIINWAGQILFELGEADYREEWFQEWAAVNIQKVSDEDIRHALDFDSAPKQLREYYMEEAERRQPELNIEKVLFARLNAGVFSQSSIDQIAELPVERYVCWLRESKNEHIGRIVRSIFSEFYGQSGSEVIIAQRTLEAVNQLSEESEINAFRARYYKRALPEKIRNQEQEEE